MIEILRKRTVVINIDKVDIVLIFIFLRPKFCLENAENSISKHLNFTISWWSMPQDPQEAHTFATRKIRLPPTFPMGTSTQWNIYFKTYWQHCYSTSGVQVYRSNRVTCLTVNIIRLRECRTVEQRCTVLTARPRELWRPSTVMEGASGQVFCNCSKDCEPYYTPFPSDHVFWFPINNRRPFYEISIVTTLTSQSS